MLGKLALMFKSKLTLAVLGAALVAGVGTTAAFASTGAHLQVPLFSQNHSGDGNNNQNDDGQQAEGTIASIDSGQSSFVFAAEHGKSVTVVVNSKTVFDNGLKSFADLKVGMHVEAKGAKQADGSLLATKVESSSDKDDGTVDDHSNDSSGSAGCTSNCGSDDHGGDSSGSGSSGSPDATPHP